MNALRKNRKTPTIADANQIDFLDTLGDAPKLIELPVATNPEPASFNYEKLVKDAVNKAIKVSPFDRDQIAAMLTELVGKKITKPMLDTYTGESRANNFPAYLIPAFTQILGASFLKVLGEASGCAVLERQEAVYARLGQLHMITVQAKEQQADLINELPMFRGSR